MRGGLRILVGVVLLAAATYAAWWGWIGHDDAYPTGQGGDRDGPWTAARATGCALTLGVWSSW